MICFLAHRDVVVYALGIGACGQNAVDTDELKYVYHENGQQFIKVIFSWFLLSLLKLKNKDDVRVMFLNWQMCVHICYCDVAELVFLRVNVKLHLDSRKLI